MRLLLVVSIALGLAGGNALVGENNETLTRTNIDSSPNDVDDKVMRRVEEQMLKLNKSNGAFRDKRALGILLQGFMEALGYTVSPIQLGSLPIGQAPAAAGMAAPRMPPSAPPMNLQQGGPVPPPQGNPIPAPPPASATPAAAASTPPRQRETLRFTGVFNFGNNSNATNLIDHLSQYERIFHGGATAQPPAAPAAPAPSIDPRSLPPLPEPLFVKIPLPIVPNLPPPQAPSPMPVQNTYHDDYQQQNHQEEYKGSEDDEGQKGNFEEEDDEGHHHEEYEHSHEEFSEPEDEEEEVAEVEEVEGARGKYNGEPKERTYETAVSHEKPPEKNRETHYKKNQHVVNYSVENKEIRDPSEVSEEVPIVGSNYGHTMYVGEPDWKQQHEEHVYRLAAEQEARAEALAEENAERERSRSSEHEDSVEQHRDREKEISENNEKHAARHEANPYYDDVKEKYNNAAEQEDYEEETETRHRETPTNAPDTNKVGVTEAAAMRRFEEKLSKSSSREDYQEDKSEQPHPMLPISYDREGSAQHQPLRDSYGESLEKPGGKIDDRVAEYITMFKNPQTGVYDPSSLQHYDKARMPYDRLDLASGFKKIKQEYGRPDSKYEEYEINDEDDNASGGEDNKAEHREESQDSEEREQHSKEALADGPHTTECNCNPRKTDAHSEEAKNPEKPATARLPTATPTPLAVLDYGPFYSTVRHLYEPSNNEQEIIARLTSYGPPTTGKFEAAPTVLAVPEKLTAQSLIQQSETKEIAAWPAPFDYVFDNSDHRTVVLKSAPTRQTLPLLPLSKPTYHEAHTLTPGLYGQYGQYTDRVHMLLREHERDNGFSTENTKKRKRRPQSSRDRKAEQIGQQSDNKVSYHQAVQMTQANASKQRKTPPTTLKPESWTEKIRAPTVPSNVLEPPTASPYRSTHRTAKLATEKVKSSRQSKGNRQTSRPQTTAKKKHGNLSPIPLTGGTPKEERSNYVEKNGILIIPEPTPYYYNEKIEEFTDEPQSDTEKVKIKEFRNRIASVKVSQLNQLHPASSMQIFKYSRNL